MPDRPPEPGSGPPTRLRPVQGGLPGMRWVAAAGGAALLAALALAFAAPSPIWFLLYPLLIVAGVAALTTAAAWLLRFL